MDLNGLKTWVAARVQKQQEQSGTVTQDEIVATLRPLYDSKIAAGAKPREAVAAMQAELADGGMTDITLTVAMFRRPRQSGFDLGDNPPLREVLRNWRAELRAMADRGWTDQELVPLVIKRVKVERPDLAAVAEQEITADTIHAVSARRRSRSKAFLPTDAPIPVAELIASWRGQIMRRAKRGWTVTEIVAALQAKIRDEYQGVDPACVTDKLVQHVINTANKSDNDTPVQSASAATAAATTGSADKPVEMAEDDIDWARSKLPTLIIVKKDKPVPKIGQLWHRAKTAITYRVLDIADGTSMRETNGEHRVAVEVVA